MFGGWFGNNAEKKEEEDTAEGEPTTQAPATEGTGGVWGFMKGMLGMDQLKVEEGGDAKTGNAIDETQRKGLFKQLSGLVGKDVTSMISLPVWVFEPASFLQVMSEPLQYEQLLKRAGETEDPIERLELAAAFNFGLYSTAVRTRKPFNPILGETFEIVHDKDGQKYKFVAEQVSHHPPISVSQTIGEGYTLQLETALKSKFYGNSTEVFIEGTNHLWLSKHGDHITWPHLVTACHNIIIGSLWLDHYGDLEIVNHTTGHKCLLKFAKAGWLGAGRYGVTGEIVDSNGNVVRKLSGKWNEVLWSAKVDANGEKREDVKIWSPSGGSLPDNKFQFSQYMLDEVLHLDAEYEAILPETDSRLRADRRALEAGDMDTASKKKHEMEEAQRARKKAREAAGEHWEPRYFQKSDEGSWKFSDKYWTEREERVAAKKA